MFSVVQNAYTKRPTDEAESSTVCTILPWYGNLSYSTIIILSMAMLYNNSTCKYKDMFSYSVWDNHTVDVM